MPFFKNSVKFTIIPYFGKDKTCAFILSLNIIFCHSLIGQSTFKNDSIYKSISTLKDDTNKIKELVNFGYTLELTDTNLCNKVYNDALRISKKEGNLYFESKTLINLGVLNKTHEKYDVAMAFYKKANAVALKSGNPEIIGSSLANIGGIYAQQNDYEAATKNTLEAVGYLEAAVKYRQLSLTIGNLCTYFERQKMYDKSVFFGLKAVDAAIKSGDARTIGLAYLNVASGYYFLSKKDEFLENSKIALEYLRNGAALTNTVQAYQNLALHYLNEKKINYASAFIDSALFLARQINISKHLAEVLILKGNIEAEINKLQVARNYLTEAKKYVDDDGNWVLLSNWNYNMYHLEIKEGHYQNAIKYLEIKYQYDDSLKNKDILEKSIALEAKLETQKKEEHIIALKKENDASNSVIGAKNNYLLLLSAALLLLVFLGIMFFRDVKKRQMLTQQQIQNLQKEKELAGANEIVKVQEAERNRVAQDLHDGLGGMLSSVKLNLSAMKGSIIIQEKDANIFNNTITQLDNAIVEMRRVAHNMMPEALLKFGLAEAIQDYCDSINQINKVKLKFINLGAANAIEKSVQVILYRIIHELTNNAIKYAGAQNIFIQLSINQNIINLTVEDDGEGFDVSQLENLKGTGLQNVQSRVDYLKGKFEIESNKNEGTSVHIEIPT